MAGSRRSLPRPSIVSIKSAIQNVAKFRWLIFIIGNFANFAHSVVLSSLSLTIVAMIQHNPERTLTITNITSVVTNSSSSDIFIEPITTASSDGKIHVNWTNVDKSRMLQASFWGTLVISAFSGRLCEVFGPRLVVSLSLLTTGITNCCFPYIARNTFIGAYLIRIVQGMCIGIIQPSCFVVISRWSTAYERTLSNAVVSSGYALGNLVSLPLTGLLVSSSFLGGWPSVFYIFGLINLLVAIIWYIFIYDTPEQHPRLSREELEEILTQRSLKSGDSVQVPWGKMFTSLPVYAYLVPQFTYGWCVAVVSSQIPSFYEDILDFSHEANGFVASLPWLVSMCSSLIGSLIADKIRKTSRFSLSNIRKAFTIIGLGTVSLGLFAITTLDKRRIAVILTLGFSKGMGTLSTAGSSSVHLDIAPTFAGTLAGFAYALSSIASLAANEGAARIIGNLPTQKNWYRFFYISSAINLSGVIIFCLIGSAECQDWDPSVVRKQSIKSMVSHKSRKFSVKSENSHHNQHHHHQRSSASTLPNQQEYHQDRVENSLAISTISTIELESKA